MLRVCTLWALYIFICPYATIDTGLGFILGLLASSTAMHELTPLPLPTLGGAVRVMGGDTPHSPPSGGASVFMGFPPFFFHQCSSSSYHPISGSVANLIFPFSSLCAAGAPVEKGKIKFCV